MLALLDRQQQSVMARAAEEVFQSIGLIQAQGSTIQNARARREECRAAASRTTLQQPDSQLLPC